MSRRMLDLFFVFSTTSALSSKHRSQQSDKQNGTVSELYHKFEYKYILYSRNEEKTNFKDPKVRTIVCTICLRIIVRIG